MYGAIDCCTSPFVNYPGFLITLSDANRIIKNTTFKIGDFAKIVNVKEEDMADPNNNYFKDLGFNNNFLYMSGIGKCPFRRQRGCVIYEHRPMMCRLFPFWFKKDKNKESMLGYIKKFSGEIKIHKKLKYKLLDKKIEKVIAENF